MTPDVRHHDRRLLRNTRQFDRYVASSSYGLVVMGQALLPLTVLAPGDAEFALWRWFVPMLAGLALTAAELLMVHWSLKVVRAGGTGLDRSLVVRWAAVVVPLLALMAVAAAPPAPDQLQWPNPFVISLAMAWSVVSLAHPLRVAALGGLAVAMIAGTYIGIVTGATSELGPLASMMASLMLGLTQVLWVGVVVFAVWSSGWMLRVIMEVNRAGRLAAELAIAEERLRISRDLHDVFGRTLATIAVKSELAESLARRGRAEQSADEMAAVRQLADDTGREIRGVIRGYREADLDREMAGAQALLESAGIRCEVSGQPPKVAREAASALAWVLREAVTNVIRHSRATSVSITFTGPDPVSMMIENNGVDNQLDRRRVRGGHGLANMAERLAAIGGRFEHRQQGDVFVVMATVTADGGADR